MVTNYNGVMTAQQKSPRTGRRPVLSRQRIVEAAIAIGFEGLTVRALAGRLGVAHSALYRWVRSRDELLDLVSDALLERVTPEPEEEATDWRAWLADLAWAIRREFLPVIDGESLAKFPRTTSIYASVQDRAQAVIRAGGIAPDAAARTYHVFLLTVWGWLAVEKACPEQIDHEVHFAAMLSALLRGLPA